MIAGCLLAAVGLLPGCASAPTSPTPPAPIAPPQQSVRVGDTTILAVGPPPAPCCKKPSIPERLGLNRLGQGIGGLLRRLSSRLQQSLGLEGRFPGLQPQAPMLPITDPANLAETAPPAVKAAAEVKKEEESAAQKVQALRYLATIGCGGCYPGVQEAFISALSDCTEAVRYEAVVALRGNSCVCCRYCNNKACCSAAVQKRLQQIAFETNDNGCFKEPSGRVRRLARQVLECCGGVVEEVGSQRPLEGPTEPLNEDPAQQAKRDEASSGIRLVGFEAPVRLPATDDLILAKVNGEPIFQSTVEPLIANQLAGRPANEIETLRRTLLKQELQRVVDSRLLRQQMQRETGNVSEPTPTSVRQWLEQRIFVDPYVSAAEIGDFYSLHHSRYHVPAAVRWERIRVPMSRFRSHDQAFAVANHLRSRATGNAAGSPPEYSPGQVEIDTFGWTKEDEIRQPQVARALLSQPVGATSGVLEGRGEFVVVRVLERRPARNIPLETAAREIEQELLRSRRSRAETAFVGQLRQQAQIWTAFETVTP